MDLTKLLTAVKADAREARAILDHRKANGGKNRQIQISHFEVTLESGVHYRSGSVTFPKQFSDMPYVAVSEASGGNWLILKIDEKGVNGFKWAAHRIFPHGEPKRGHVRNWDITDLNALLSVVPRARKR